MRKKIGILSFPSACNYGAFLQVYALQKYLLLKGYDVEVINYRNKNHYLNEMRAMFLKRNLSLIFFNLIRLLSFRLSQKSFSMSAMTFDINKVNTRKFDYIVIGGDIVWDFNTSFLGHDPVYFGHNLNADKLITYAASAGNAKADKAPYYVQDGLKNFSSLGVRDFETFKITESAECHKEIVLDTTLIYDFSFDERRVYSEDYILIYAFEITDKDKIQIINFAKDRNLKILSITFNENLKWVDKNYFYISPLNFLNLIKNASFIYTSTFHGLLLSLKYRKQVALRNNSTIKSKCSWLMNELNLNSIDLDHAADIDSIWTNPSLFSDKFELTFTKLVTKSREFLESSLRK